MYNKYRSLTLIAKDKFDAAIVKIVKKEQKHRWMAGSYEDLNVQDCRITSWRNWKPRTHIECALDLGDHFVILFDSGRIGRRVGHESKSMVRAYDAEQLLLFFLSRHYGWESPLLYYNLLLKDLNRDFNMKLHSVWS